MEGATAFIFAVMMPLCLLAKKNTMGIYSEGHIMVGGVFPVHANGVGESACGSINRDRGIQRLEAMRFAVKTINEDPKLLRGIKLGTRILDTCSDPTYALDQSLEFVMSTLSASQSDQCQSDVDSDARPQNQTIASVIGAALSKVSLDIANLFRLFEIPQISYASTSAELSDKERFGYFMRTVPPDKLQAKALADIINSLNWTFVSTVASDGDYGESGIDAFKREYAKNGQCLAAELKVPSKANYTRFEAIVKELNKARSDTDSKARVVVLFVGEDDAAGILNATTSLGLINDFVWVASEGWGKAKKPVLNNENTAQGALTITLKSRPIPDFDEYFRNLTTENNKQNIWFCEYWEKTYDCNFPPTINCTYTNDYHRVVSKKICTGTEKDLNYQQESKIQFVYDAVYALALALDRLYKETCGSEAIEMCEQMTLNNTMRTKLMQYIKGNKKKGEFICCKNELMTSEQTEMIDI